MVTALAMVPGRTVSVTVAMGVVLVSRTVRMTVVSALTGLAITRELVADGRRGDDRHDGLVVRGHQVGAGTAGDQQRDRNPGVDRRRAGLDRDRRGVHHVGRRSRGAAAGGEEGGERAKRGGGEAAESGEDHFGGVPEVCPDSTHKARIRLTKWFLLQCNKRARRMSFPLVSAYPAGHPGQATSRSSFPRGIAVDSAVSTLSQLEEFIRWTR